MEWQEQRCEHERDLVRSRTGFSTLTNDQSHHALRPFSQATTDTTAEAVAPPLSSLVDGFEGNLKRAADLANEHLDALVSEGDKPTLKRVDLGLRNREVGTEAEVEALVDEIRKRMLEHVKTGARVRLL